MSIRGVNWEYTADSSDAATHMIEEIPRPGHNAPKVMYVNPKEPH